MKTGVYCRAIRYLRVSVCLISSVYRVAEMLADVHERHYGSGVAEDRATATVSATLLASANCYNGTATAAAVQG